MHIKNIELYLPNQKQNDMNEHTQNLLAYHYRDSRMQAADYAKKWKNRPEMEVFELLYKSRKEYADGLRFAILFACGIDLKKIKA